MILPIGELNQHMLKLKGLDPVNMYRKNFGNL